MRIKILLALIFCSVMLYAVELPQRGDVPMISVGISGYVEAPGTYLFTPVSRLSDVLAQQQALALENLKVIPTNKLPEQAPIPRFQAPDKQQDETKLLLKIDPAKQALRTVKLTRDGKTLVYDLLKFLRSGDASQNPLLRDGDLILIDAVSQMVEISGAVNLPGELEYVQGDKLSDLIRLAQGFSYDADNAGIQLYRYKSNRIDFDLRKLDGAEDYALQAYDRIIVPRALEISQKLRVTVSGQVRSPGEYIIGDNSTLYQVLQQAGGLSSRADIKNLICYNEYLNENGNALMDFLSQRSTNDMTPLEYSYLRTGLQQLRGKYSLDPGKMWDSEGKEEDLKLHDGDRIYVPEQMDMVWVSGQVRHPGMISWVEGADWEYYIKQAGGYANNRKVGKGRLIRGYSGNWVKPTKSIKIMPGDTVFVPEQTDRSLWVDIKDIVLLVSSAITIIVGLDAITKP